MGTRKKVVLGTTTYASKKELRAAVQAYIREAENGIPLPDTFPYAIFDQHPHREEKTGVGLQHIEIRPHPEYKNRGFYVVRTDGTVIDFSWQVALGFTHSGPTLAAAARWAIRDQIATVAAPSMHVHHEGRSFQQLLDGWLTSLEGRIPELIHGDLHDYFRDPADEASWQEYHQMFATLRLVTTEEHKRLHKEQKS